MASSGASASVRQIVFVDPHVPDLEHLIAGLDAGAQAHLLDPARSALAQIADRLEQCGPCDALHIVAHGAPGEIHFASGTVSRASLADDAAALARIGAALAPGADILLWACDAGRGASGEKFLDALADATGANVAAATHPVGSPARGGSWQLDAAVGSVAARVPFTERALNDYQGILVVLGTVTGQLWYTILDVPGPFPGFPDTRRVGGYFNSDGSAITQAGGELSGTSTPPVTAYSIAVDTAAGYFFVGNSDHLSVSVYRISDNSLVQTVQVGDAGPGDLVDAIAVDPINHILFVNRWDSTTTATGIVKITYDPATGLLNSPAAYTDAQNFLITNASTFASSGGAFAYTNANNLEIDIATHKLYYTDWDNTYDDATFDPTNAIFVVSDYTSVSPTVTQLTLSSQFPANASNGFIGNIAVDDAKGLIYFTTLDFSLSTGQGHVWYMPIAGGTAVEIQGLDNLHLGDSVPAGLSLDPVNQQLYINTAYFDPGGPGVGVDPSANANHILVYQLSADGHSFSSLVASYDMTQLEGQPPTDTGSHPGGSQFQILPTLSVTGAGTHAGEQGGSVGLTVGAVISSDVDGGYYNGATVKITGGTFSSNENSTADDHLTISGAASGTSGAISWSYISGTETLALTGYDTIANYNSILALVQYNATGDNPTNYGANATRTLTWTVSDGSLNVPADAQNSDTTTLDIDAVNDAPDITVGGGDSASIAVNETNSGINQSRSLTITDPDSLTETLTLTGFSHTGPTGGISDATLEGFFSVPPTVPIAGATGFNWTFNSGAEAFNFLTASDVLTLNYTIHDVDSDDTGSPSNPLPDDQAIVVTITGTNDAPVVTAGNVQSYTENGAAIAISPAAAITDADSADFNGGSLTVAFTANGTAADQLTIGNDGTGPGQIGVSGNTVTYGGLTIGTFTGGSNGGDLVVTFTTADATAAAAQALLRDIRYANSSDDPSALTRTVTYSVIDGDGGTDTGTATATINFTADNDAPGLAVPLSPLSGTPNTPVTITGVTFSDVDGEGGAEQAQFTATAGNVFNAISGGGVIVTGDGTNSLFLTGSTTDLTSFIAGNNLTFTAPSSDTVHVILNDQGHTPAPAKDSGIKDIAINLDDPPTIADLNGDSTTFTEDGPQLLLDQSPAATVADTDSTDFDGGNLTVAISAGGTAAEDALSIVDGNGITVSLGTVSYNGNVIGTVAGGSSGNPLVVTFTTTDATPAAATALIEQIAYQNTNNANPSTTDRTISFTVDDGDGGTSTNSDVTVHITAVNDAPVLNAAATPVLNAVSEDAGAPVGAVGTLVSALVDLNPPAGGLDNVTEPDGFAFTGIALTGVDTANGTWFYSLDGGTSWLAVGAVTDDAALLLGANGSTRLYFQPNADFSGLVSNAITFRAWDVSTGTNGGTADPSPGGGTTAFSTASDTADITVTAVNDAPVLNAAATPVLNAVNEDAPAPVGAVGALVSSLVDLNPPAGGNDNVTDVDASPLTGIALTGVDTANGSWFYTTDGGGSWNAVGAVTDDAALLLAADSSTRLYFQPTTANFNGTITNAITFRAWDQSTGSNGGTADPTPAGGTTAFSAVSDTADITVTAVNDAPVFTNLGGAPPTFTENGSSVVLDGNVTVSDLELQASVNNYAGATLTLVRNGGANSDDTFAGTGTLDLADAGVDGNVSLDSGGTFIGTATNPGDGTFSITFNANATAANIASVMNQIIYANASDNPPASVQIDWTFSDGNGQPGGQNQGAGPTPGVATGSSTVNITQVDDAPALLNVAVAASYSPGSPGQVLSPALQASDPDAAPPSPNPGLVSATITITAGFLAGDELFVNLTTSGGFFVVDDGGGPVTTNISVTSNAGGQLVLGGLDSVLHYQDVLDAVSYHSTAADPTNGGADPTRTINWKVSDGALDNQAPSVPHYPETTLGFNAAPVVDLDGSTAGNNYVTTFTENGAPLAIANANASVTDPDDATISGATIVLTNAKPGDALSIAGALPGGIGSSIDTSVPGQITIHLSNQAAVADYQTALGQIRFVNTSDNPNVTDRDITVQMSNIEDSNVAHATVHITPVNDAPVANIVPTSYSATEQTSLNLKNNGLAVSDIDGNAGNETVTLSVSPQGILNVSAGSSGAIVSNSGTATVTITGTTVQINALLNTDATSAVAFFDNSDTPASSVTLALAIHDNGNTGGGDLSSSDSATINIAAVNDTPVAVTPTTHYSATEQVDLNLKNTGMSVSDIDALGATETATLSVNEGILNIIAGSSGAAVSGSGTNSVTITGTLAQINALLNTNGTSSVIYNDDLDNPSASVALTLQINDGGATGSGGAKSGSHSSTIDVTPVNDPPVLASVADHVGVPPTGGPVTLSPGLIVSDPDNTTLASATVAITAGTFAGDGDVLAANTSGTSISASYNSATETLTLTGSDTLAHYQSVLESITYQTTSANPSNGGANLTRTVTWTVNDGSASNNLSAPATTTLTMSAPPRSDFNGDRNSDLLLQNQAVGNSSVMIDLMNGATITSSAIIADSTGIKVEADGDFNHDNKADIVLQRPDGTPEIWFMDGTSVTGKATLPNPGTSWHVIATGDFDTDGNADILWQNNDGSPSVWLMNGTSVVGWGALPNPGPSWHAIGTGDFNGDGHSDILWQNADGSPSIWEMNGTTITGWDALPNPGTSWHVIGTGDFNGDGHSDILWQNNDGSPSIWEMNGGSVVGWVALPNPGTSWHVIGSSDINGDGKSDILWQNNDGSPSVWEMNGSSIVGWVALPNPGSAWQLKDDGPIAFNAAASTTATGTASVSAPTAASSTGPYDPTAVAPAAAPSTTPSQPGPFAGSTNPVVAAPGQPPAGVVFHSAPDAVGSNMHLSAPDSLLASTELGAGGSFLPKTLTQSV